MVILRSLSISGFRSFKDAAEISFPTEGAMLISGSYTDGSGGSSGAGKSSIILAVAHALGFCDVPATELKNWYSKKYSVKLCLESDGKVYTIVRDPKLSIEIDGEVVPGGAADAEKAITVLLKAPIELAKNLVYRPQLKGGEFLNSTDAQKKEFLSAMLGLQEVEAAADQVKIDLDKKKNEIQQLENEIKIREAQLLNMAVEESSIFDAEDKVDKARAAVAGAMAKLEPAENEYAEALHNEAQAKAQASALTPDTTKGDAEYNKLANEARNIQATIAQYNSLSRKAESARTQNKAIRSQIMSLQAEIEELDKSICPTCKREWSNAEALIGQKSNEIDKLLSVMQSNVESISTGEQAQENIPVLQKQYDETMKRANEAKRPEEEQVKAYESAMAVYNSMKSTSQATRSAKLAVEQEVSSAKASLSSAESYVKNLKDQCVRYGAAKLELSGITGKLELANKELAPLEHAIKLLGRDGFLGVIFDEVLAEIEFRANEMISMIPNISTFVVSINSTTTTKVGAVKKSINVKVLKDGFEVNLKALSGGQTRALELCSDLAVRETIRARFGSNLGFVILDEAMENLGAYEKSFALEAVKSKVQGQVIVIDHATEVKEGFASTIEVKFDGRNSWVV